MTLLLLHGHVRPGPGTSGVHATVDGALLMAAMMLPLVAPSANLVAERSFRRRRRQAIGEHVIAFAAIWFVFGLAVSVSVGSARLLVPQTLLFAGLVTVAAIWQVSGRRRQLLERGSRVRVAGASGWGAHLGGATAGASEGVRCIRRCWASMLAMAAAPHAVLMAIVLAGNLSEWAPGPDPWAARRYRRPVVPYVALAALSAAWSASATIR